TQSNSQHERLAMPHDVFISYSSHDKAVADAACAALEAQKIRCWIAPRDVPPATDFANEIVKAIDDCRAMVLVFSAKANKSADIGSEVYLAFSREIPIISLRIENVAPEGAMKYRLGKTHWLDALTPPIEKRIGELVESVARLLARQVSVPLGSSDSGLRKSSTPAPEIPPVSIRTGTAPSFEPTPQTLNARCRDALWAERNKTIVPAPSIGVPLDRRSEVVAEAKKLLEQSVEIFAPVGSIAKRLAKAKSLHQHVGLMQVADGEGVYEQGEQQLRFWKQRVIRFLDANLSSEDAALFAGLGTSLGGGNNIEHLNSSYMAHSNYLKGLIEELDKDDQYPISPRSNPSGSKLPLVKSFTWKSKVR
ncbi:MAG: toll/interleukin-1 receptor domain-containing protein, partial [Roseimicrobium sp.]